MVSEECLLVLRWGMSSPLLLALWETLLIQWQWWMRRESIRPEVHIS